MQRSRETVSKKRTTFLMSMVVCLPAVLFAQVMMPKQSPIYDIFLQRSTETYPSWIGYGWLPLDVLVAVGMIYLAIHATTTIHDDALSVVSLVKISYGFLGGFMGGALTISLGWYAGIEGLLLAGTACAIFLATIYGLVCGAYLLHEYYQKHVAVHVSPLVRPLKRYLDAEDVPETEEKT